MAERGQGYGRKLVHAIGRMLARGGGAPCTVHMIVQPCSDAWPWWVGTGAMCTLLAYSLGTHVEKAHRALAREARTQDSAATRSLQLVDGCVHAIITWE